MIRGVSKEIAILHKRLHPHDEAFLFKFNKIIMINEVKINATYKNVFTGDKVTVIECSGTNVQYLKHEPVLMNNCDIPDPKTIKIKVDGIMENIQIGKVVESKRIMKIQEHLLYPHKDLSRPSEKIDYVLSEFIKPLKVFNQTYTEL